MKNLHLIGIFIWILSITACSKGENHWQLSSLGENLKIDLSLEDGKLSYVTSIQKNDSFVVVIKKSSLGIIRKDADFTGSLSFVKKGEIKRIDERYKLVTGKAHDQHNLANELTVTFGLPSGELVDIVLRAYNDGVAFRYQFPEDKNGAFEVTGEITGFNIPEGKAWIEPYDDVTKWTPAYELFYESEVPIGEDSPQKNGWCFPALFHTNNVWILLTEAGLDGDFYGAHLNPLAKGGLYTIRMPEKEEAMEVYAQNPIAHTLPWVTPWRVIIIGSELNTIIASNLVTDLSPASRIKNTSWIKPGRASWSWLSDANSPQDFFKLKNFVDLAVAMNWEYSLVDANWNKMKGGDIQQLVEYAHSKNIGILLWYNSGGPHNAVEEEVRDRMHMPDIRRAEFAKLQQWGVKGVKIDFFQSDKPGMMQLYKDILEDAAHYEIMVNFHGCTIPRGWSRTYPNLMSMEAVRGAECYTFSDSYPENAPVNNTILPVTRNVVGSMDYTPVLFSDMKFPHITSYGHELALSILFETGLLHFADKAESFTSLPESPKTFLKNVPVTWDETRHVAGYPGKEMVLARRDGDTWYVAGINGENKEKEISLSLPFLSEGQHTAELITDGASARSFSSQSLKLNSRQALDLPMIPHGGFVLKIGN